MRRQIYRLALMSAASMIVVPGSEAFAQSASETPDSDAIIVTARRVEERLQDVPISMTVVDQERLAKSNIASTDDLLRVVPGLNVRSGSSSEQATFAIRGFAQELRTSASVGTYFGEVVAPRGGAISVAGGDGAGPGNLFDLQSVQVLKGPQGTLFGRNTTGGAVMLTPKKPTDRIEGYVEGAYGNYDMKRVQAVVNAPLGDWIRLRLGVDHQNRDGYLHNVSGIGPRDYGNVDYTAVRGSLVLDLAPSLENYTIVSYIYSDNNGTGSQLFRANPASAVGRMAAAQVNRLTASGDPYQIERKLINPRALTKQFQAINTTTWRAADDLTVKNIMSYSTIKQDIRSDIFSSNIIVAGTTPPAYFSTSLSFNPDGFHSNDQKNFTEELQVQGKLADGRLDYQGGVYFEHSTPGGQTASLSPSVGAVCLVSGFNTLENMACRNGTATLSKGTIEFINLAAYAQATYALTDTLKLTGGLRYTYDRSKGTSNSIVAAFRPAVAGQFVAPTITGCAVGYSASSGCNFQGRTSSQRPTWTVNLAYSPTRDAMVYGTYSRGYRQGAVVPFAVAGNPFFGPEKVDNFEVGTKLTIRGAVSGTLNFAGFYSRLSDQQLQVGLQNTTTGQSATSIFNAGKSRIYGVEFDGALRFSPLFRIEGSGAYIDSKLESITLPTSFAGYNAVIPTALAGDPLPYTSKWALNVGGVVTAPLDESVGRIEFSAYYRYNSSYATAASTSTTFRSTPVKQLDLNLDWHDVLGKPFDLSVFATNVTNQFTRTTITPLYNSLGFDTQNVGQPRFYGVRLRIRFGEPN